MSNIYNNRLTYWARLVYPCSVALAQSPVKHRQALQAREAKGADNGRGWFSSMANLHVHAYARALVALKFRWGNNLDLTLGITRGTARISSLSPVRLICIVFINYHSIEDLQGHSRL